MESHVAGFLRKFPAKTQHAYAGDLRLAPFPAGFRQTSYATPAGIFSSFLNGDSYGSLWIRLKCLAGQEIDRDPHAKTLTATASVIILLAILWYPIAMLGRPPKPIFKKEW